MWDIIKTTNIYVVGTPWGEKTEENESSIQRNNQWNFPNVLWKSTHQEAQWIPSKIIAKETHRQIILKILKIKEKE